MTELEAQYRDEKDEPEACFIEEALQYLSQHESGIDVPRQVLIKEESTSVTFVFIKEDAAPQVPVRAVPTIGNVQL